MNNLCFPGQIHVILLSDKSKNINLYSLNPNDLDTKKKKKQESRYLEIMA